MPHRDNAAAPSSLDISRRAQAMAGHLGQARGCFSQHSDRAAHLIVIGAAAHGEPERPADPFRFHPHGDKNMGWLDAAGGARGAR